MGFEKPSSGGPQQGKPYVRAEAVSFDLSLSLEGNNLCSHLNRRNNIFQRDRKKIWMFSGRLDNADPPCVEYVPCLGSSSQPSPCYCCCCVLLILIMLNAVCIFV